VRKATKIAKNSSYITARALLLDAVRRRHRLWEVSITLMAATATAGSLCQSGTARRHVEQGPNSLSFQRVGDVGQPAIGNATAEIAVGLVLVGPVHAGTDALQATHYASRELAVVLEFITEILNDVRTLESAEFARPRFRELDSRLQVEAHGVRALPDGALIQGIRSIVVATGLATIAAQVDSALASRSRIVSLIATVKARLWRSRRGLGVSRGRRIEREDRWASARIA
jgi:hypothetical protein